MIISCWFGLNWPRSLQLRLSCFGFGDLKSKIGSLGVLNQWLAGSSFLCYFVIEIYIYNSCGYYC